MQERENSRIGNPPSVGAVECFAFHLPGLSNLEALGMTREKMTREPGNVARTLSIAALMYRSSPTDA